MKFAPHIGLIVTTGISLALASCSTGGRSPSGFLSNYSQLDAGYGTANAVAAYVKPGVDLGKYDSVIIDPVTTVIAAPEISSEVKEQIAAYLYGSLRSQVPSDLKVVDSPGPATLRVRAALTDVIGDGEHSIAVTTLHSSPRVTLKGKLGSDELAAFISKVSLEAEILDSATGERISALSDRRIGAKREATAATSWEAVRSATNQRTANLWQRFSAARGS